MATQCDSRSWSWYPALRYLILALATCLVATTRSYADGSGSSARGAGDWPHVNSDLYESRYSALDSIHGTNANRLKRVCVYVFPDKEPSQTAPIAIAGVVYASTAHYTVAVDGFDCHVVGTNK
jgi:alcohol dehydrogenase (cytochrome c)